MTKKYLKIIPSPDPHFDTFYYNLSSDNNWKDVLSHVEQALEQQWFDLDENTVGIKMEIEIVDTLPDDIEEQ